ncbi:MAG: OsmC family protein [Deltaproteobacteria bacterium]|nr:OsmC family protein [Deltaproteobacteria bacterium]
MPARFPHNYQVSLVRLADHSASIASGGATTLSGGPPVQFDGRDDVWSPEQLLVGAASLCLMTTFEAVSRRAQLAIDGYRCSAEGILDKTAAGIVFTRIDLAVTLTVAPEHEARARELLATAKKHCIISNSLKAPVELSVTIEAPPAQPALH